MQIYCLSNSISHRVCREWFYLWLHTCEEGASKSWTGPAVGRTSCWRYMVSQCGLYHNLHGLV